MRRNFDAFLIAGRPSISSFNRNNGGISEFFNAKISVFLAHFHSARNSDSCNQRYKSGLAFSVNNLDDAVSLYKQMVYMRPLPSVIDFNRLLGRVIKIQEYSAAVSFYKNMRSLGIPINHFTMTMTINCYFLMSRVDCAFSVLGCFFKSGYVPGVITFNTVLKGLFRQNMVREAQDLLRKIIHEKICEPDEFTYGIHNQRFKNGFADGTHNVDDAVGLYKQMVQMSPLPSVIDFNQLLGRIVKMKHYSTAVSLYKDMCFLGIPLDDYTMNMVINCYSFVSRMACAFSILGCFFKHGYLPNVTTFNTLLKGLFRQNRIAEAQELFRKITYEKLCEPDEFTYGTVIDGLCKVGNTSMAIKVLRVMERGKCKPDTIVYSTIIDSLSKDKMVNEALALLREMIEKEIAPNVITYSCLIQSYCNLGKWKEAKMLWSGMLDFNIAPNVYTYNVVIDALCKEGKIEDAEDVIDTIIEKGESPDTITYNSLMDGYCMVGQIDDARRVLDRMEARGLSPDICSYTILINGYFKKLEADEAMRLFREIPFHDLKPNVATYNTILQGIFRAGRCATAKQVFNEMQAAQLNPDFFTYCVMLEGLSKNSHTDEAFLLLQKMESDGVDLHISMFNIIIHGFCKSGKLGIAQNIFQSLSNKGLRPDVVTYTSLIKGLTEAGKHKEAKESLIKMKEDGCLLDDLTYNTIIRGFLKGGENVEAKMHLQEMVGKGFSPDSFTVSMLLDLVSAEGNNPNLLDMVQTFAPKPHE